MTSGTPEQSVGGATGRSRPYGYNLPVVQDSYIPREAASQAAFFLPHLRPGMTLLDCGCGPGTITLGLAEAVSPGEVVGIDLEPGMVELANGFARERDVTNVRFEVADIGELPFQDDSFDAVFTCAVLEHLAEPGDALQEICRVLRPGGVIGVHKTDWGEPLITPPSESMKQFFQLFERGFKHYGGSLNRGRHLRVLLRQSGFDVTEFSASYSNSATPEEVRDVVEGYIGWIENLPLFDEALELGWIDRPTLDTMKAGMAEWSTNPDAFLATGRCEAIGWKRSA